MDVTASGNRLKLHKIHILSILRILKKKEEISNIWWVFSLKFYVNPSQQRNSNSSRGVDNDFKKSKWQLICKQ